MARRTARNLVAGRPARPPIEVDRPCFLTQRPRNNSFSTITTPAASVSYHYMYLFSMHMCACHMRTFKKESKTTLCVEVFVYDGVCRCVCRACDCVPMCRCVHVCVCAYDTSMCTSLCTIIQTLTHPIPPHPLPRPLLYTHKDAALQRITLVATHQECVSATLVVSHRIQSAGFARTHTHTHTNTHIYTPPPRVRFCHFSSKLHDSKRWSHAHTHMHAKTHTYTPPPRVRVWYFSGKSHT